MSLKFLVGIFLAAILTENYILNKFLGICPFLGVSKKLNTAFGMSCAVTVVMVIATAVTWPVYTYVLVPLNLDYLQTVVFILIIAALVQLLETVMHKYMPPLYNALGIYLAAHHDELRRAGRDDARARKRSGKPELRLFGIACQRVRRRHRLHGCNGHFRRCA